MQAHLAHTPETFSAQIAAFIDRHDLLGRRAAVLVAVSGGADSVALLHVLAELATDPHRRYRVHVGHLDHALRTDAAEDARFVADLADALALPVLAERIDVASKIEPGESLEGAARRVRYDFLGRAARRCGCDFIATAHHADDNVETVLHRIVRGTGVEGLAGIRPKRPLAGEGRPYLIRPMLNVRRSEIEAFLAARSITWRDDSTNTDRRYTRNRIRAELLPLLREHYNPKIDAAIHRLIQAASWAEQTLSCVAEQSLAESVLEFSPGQLALAVEKVNSLGPAAASLVVRAALEAAAAPMRRIGMDHIQRVLGLLAQSSGTGRIELPDGVRIERRYDRLLIRTEPAPTNPPDVTCPVAWPGRTDLPDGSALHVTLQAGGAGDLPGFIAGKDSFTEMIDADRITPPVTLRRWRDGDRFNPLGGPGTQKLSDFFGSARVSPDARRKAWVLTDAEGIVWVTLHRIDSRVRITDTTAKTALVLLETTA